jgi:hypothetical protein
MSRRSRQAGWKIAAVFVAALIVSSHRAYGHDIPNDVIVQAFVKPEGQQLYLLVRVPLEALRDVDFPKRGPGYLDLVRAEPSLRDAATIWIGRETEIYEEDARLAEPRIAAIRPSLPSDRLFQSYEMAAAYVTGPPLEPETDLIWNQAMLDVLFEYAIASDRSRFSIRPGVRPLGLRVTTALRFVKPDGAVRAFELHDDPGLVRLDPSWQQAVIRFVQLGFAHILSGTDHLLFLLCLVIPVRRLRTLVLVVTSFTVAHSITLLASAYDKAPGGLWFPPLVETLIAMSIVYMALENIVGAGVKRRWMIAFGFGLIHGFGFSFALRETMQFAGTHLLSSLLSFNLGVEAGQVLVLLIAIPALNLLFRFVAGERMGTIILSALVAHTGWHWMTDRGQQLAQFPWPAVDAAAAASAIRWVMLIVVVAAAVWALRHVGPAFPPSLRSISAELRRGLAIARLRATAGSRTESRKPRAESP